MAATTKVIALAATLATICALAHSCCLPPTLSGLECLDSPLAPALSGSPCITPLDDCLLAQAPCLPAQNPLLAKIAQLKALKRAKMCGGLLSPSLKLKLLLAHCL